MFGIGKTTAKKVLEELFNDGIITKQQGVGFFVRPNVKVKLKLKHFSNVESQINQIVSEALASGFDQNQIVECVQNAIHSFKETEPSC
jgi:DNA-binding transcriptional regulator YhcF (GntR family)